ncbi:DUF2309 domain-containing protein [Hanstruepera neustonica]|uniref:Probable inorganic carbon transporter subunit DabA n=1 Tax=Hanstruepera neustonica TaxID=1445657 RepID=A0A2K1DVI4_9FLAO|nr:DUF2309 domain-containing protein [Hanstruepera neustonica]PNQ72040.1 DUF2309 domain-containing protein [Hanstruepera neustonica]
MIDISIKHSIEEASKVIGKTWPLYSFVTSNPLSGYENQHFTKAIKQARLFLNAQVFPNASLFRDALDQGAINRKLLVKMLKENAFTESPEFYLSQLATGKNEITNDTHNLDRTMSKWLAVFMDEGLAEWEMPNKQKGFFKAWRKLAVHDNSLPKLNLDDIPLSSEEALSSILKDFPKEDYIKIFTYHLAALPGWTGYINYRNTTKSIRQETYPIILQDYLAVRLCIAKITNAKIAPEKTTTPDEDKLFKLQYIWLQAWEKSWQSELERLLKSQKITHDFNKESANDLEAQMVFCIDTRSELIRRHVESAGKYETYGYAGFFGIAMDYKSLDNELIRKSCPPILDSSYQASEVTLENQKEQFAKYTRITKLNQFKEYILKRMKNMLPSAFGFVEGSGVLYFLFLIARTFAPGYLLKINKNNSIDHESFCEPQLKIIDDTSDNEEKISLEVKVNIIKSAFDLMGWKSFSPIILLVGHGSHSANNPFGSSLDCGACAASPGRHNARVFAKLANDIEVRKNLKELHDIDIPESTVFIGAEHNTTTDEIILFDSDVPKSHFKTVANLKLNLAKAQQTATQERMGIKNGSVALANKKANNWSDTRPEWGLAKNASFIIGPRSLTQGKNLDGRCFLHSYDWKTDENGKALEAIMQGPMVVTQWINNHYYFAMVDNNIFGGGSKITHNITGKFGVVQGNGGDLKMGLPLQSLQETDSKMYHQPLRLSVVIQAPISRVSEILLRNDNIKTLFDNEWIYLMVLDPTDNNNFHYYEKRLVWISENTKINNRNQHQNSHVFEMEESII